MERVLVTGGAGFIGSHLVDALVGLKHPVTVLDDFSTGKETNLESALRTGLLRVVEGSVLNEADIEVAIADCSIVFHLAVKSVRHSLGAPEENHAVNAGGTLKALEAARRRNLRRFIYCSSSEVYGNAPSNVMSENATICCPTTIYGASKLAGEGYAAAYLRTYQLPTVIVRPFNAFGPRAHSLGESGEVIPRFIARALSGLPPIIFGDGTQTRDFTYVSDTVSGLIAAGDRDAAIGQTVNIGRGEAISILSLANTILELCGQPDLVSRFQQPRPGDVMSLQADISRCWQILGFKPKVSLRDGLDRYISWLRESGCDISSLVDNHYRNWRLS